MTCRKPREHAGEHSKDFKAIRAAARREAEAMLDDATRDNALDTRIVNKIGQTARQYASGTAGLWITCGPFGTRVKTRLRHNSWC